MAGKNFLFVYPKTPDTYWSFKHALKFIGKRAMMPPLGLATVAALLPEDYDCRIVDLNVEDLSEDDILSADLVLVSAMLVQRDSFRWIVERCNRLGVPVAAGGPYPTACRDEMKDVDFLVLNEGEITFPRFLEDWERGTPAPVYESREKPDLSAAPVPRFDLVDVNRYNVLPLQFSRGCPFGCEFCDIVSLFGRTPRTKSPERFLSELTAAYETGFRGTVFIVDDNFIGNKTAVKSLLPELIRWQKEKGHPFQFCTEASVNLAADPELLDLMVDAGFYMVFLGIETPVEASLEAAGKVQNMKRDIRESVKLIQARGIEVTAGLIVGFDSDPPDIFDRQIEFIGELAIPVAMIGLLTALPNTVLHKRLARENRLLASSNGNNTHSVEMNFKPVLPADFLTDGYLRILASIYDPKSYFRRCLDFFDRLPRARATHVEGGGGRTFSARNVGALVRSLVRQTFSRYGIDYLRYLKKALIRHPDHLVRIISMAIQGHHLFLITREILASKPVPKKAGKLSRILQEGPALQLPALGDSMEPGTVPPSTILS